MPHGSYSGYYPQTKTRRQAREVLGLGEKEFVFLVFGSIRPYKNITRTIEAFRRVREPFARLLIAGRKQFPAYARTVLAEARQDPRTIIHAREIPDDEVQNFFLASDVLALPRPVYCSGAAVLALDFGLPLLSPRMNHVADIALDGALVSLKTETIRDLAKGLERALVVDYATAKEDARRSSRALAWPPIAARLAKILQDDHKHRS